MTSLAEQAVFAFLRVHDKVYQATNGRIGHRMPGMPPSLLLHTVGAKTGQPRTTTLSYVKDGDDYLVVASKGGDPRSPGWYHNLKANPDIEINRRFGSCPRHSPTGATRQSRLCATLETRQREQRQPLCRVPEEDITSDSSDCSETETLIRGPGANPRGPHAGICAVCADVMRRRGGDAGYHEPTRGNTGADLE